MRIIKFLAFCAVDAFTVVFSACSGCTSNKTQGPQPTPFEQSLQTQDTLGVEHAVAQFFENIQQKKFYDAAAMLYTRQDTAETPRQYTNEEMDQFVQTYKQLPFAGYKINYMKFLSSKQNEIACTMILQKGQNGQPDAVTKLFFVPVMVAGQWCLILTDSRKFEEPVTNYQQRDSLKERYDNYKKTHK